MKYIVKMLPVFSFTESAFVLALFHDSSLYLWHHRFNFKLNILQRMGYQWFADENSILEIHSKEINWNYLIKRRWWVVNFCSVKNYSAIKYRTNMIYCCSSSMDCCPVLLKGVITSKCADVNYEKSVTPYSVFGLMLQCRLNTFTFNSFCICNSQSSRPGCQHQTVYFICVFKVSKHTQII